LTGKLVVGVALENEFDSLDLDIGMYDAFDLQTHYFRTYTPSYGKKIKEKLGLRSLSYHYFGIDIQRKGSMHDCVTDALYFVRLFLEIYCKMSQPPFEKDGNQIGTNEIEHLK
jgi:hypothetical protein